MIKIPQLFRTYIWLVETIRRYQPITLEEINRIWTRTELSEGSPIPRNTFSRHLQAIEEMFDILITCSHGKGASYRIADASQLRSNTLQRWMLSTMSVAGAVQESRTLHDRILLENVPSGDILLTELTRAMQNSHTLTISYRKFIDSQPYQCEVEPYSLKLFRQRWYLLARRTDRSYLAIYALDRMEFATETEQSFRLPDAFMAEQHFRHMYGVFQPGKDEEPVHIRLRTYNGEWNYLRTLPLHHSQKEVKTNGHKDNKSRDAALARADAKPVTKPLAEHVSASVSEPVAEPFAEPYVDFTLYVSPTYDLKLELLAHANNIEVLEPQSLRQEMYDMLQRAARRYEQGKLHR